MTPREEKTNNDYLCSLNMNDTSREEKIAWLCRIIDNEISKPEEKQDLDLICVCTDFMKDLNNDTREYPITDAQVDEILDRIGEQHRSQNSKTTVILKPRRKQWIRVCAALAAVFVAMFTTLTVAAKTQGYSNAWEFVSQNIQKIFGMDTGDKLEGDGIALIKGGESISYSSIEELIEQEGFDFLYPAVLPEGVKITGVYYHEKTQEEKSIVFTFNNDALSFSITNVFKVSEDSLTNFEKYNTQTITFYIETINESLFQAIGRESNYEYRIICNDINTLKSIINNLKG